MIGNACETGWLVRTAAAALTAVALLTLGCVTTGTGVGGLSMPATPSWLGGSGAGASTDSAAPSDLTPAERRMREQSKAFQRTVWEGALIGAGAGALWGVIQRDDTKDVLKKALIGGAVGGLAGAYIAHKQKQYSSKEDQLNSMITDVRESNQQTKELISSTREVIAEDKRRLAAVEKRYKAGQATEVELKATRARITENKAVIAQATQGAREKSSMFEGAERTYRQQNPETDTKTLQSEINAFNQQIETLDGLADTISVA
jgi:hypothetical protein